jgi:uncharacterized membrane protein YdjX (TVP38/TMEM64 family)
MQSRTLIRVFAAVVLVAAMAGLYLSPARQYLTIGHARAFAAQLAATWWGPLAFVASYAVGAVLLIPASLFVLSAGVIWGWKLGGLYAMLGGILGAVSSFGVARLLGGGVLERFGNRGTQLADQLKKARFKSLLILRLIPVFPFAMLNYGSGVAGVRFRDFAMATALGLAPSTFVFAYSADALLNGSLTRGGAVIRVVIAAAAMAVLVLVPGLLKKRAVGALEAGE